MDEQKERSNAEGKSQVGKTCRQNKQKIIEFLFRHKLMFGILATLVLLIGIPFLINVLYMLPIWFPHIPRLVTMWSSSDVLAYYGTILGAAATIGALVGTIGFTQKQIQRENYLRAEQEKWSRIDNSISEIINLLNPMTLIIIKHDQKPKESAKEATNAIQMCMIKMNLLNGNTTVQDKSKIEKLWNAIDNFIQRSLEVYRRIYTSTENCFEDFVINQGCKDLIALYDTNYNKLVSLKSETFSQIYADIQKEADNILSPWRKH